MLQTFSTIKNAELSGLLVWVPMVPGDSALEAAALVAADDRLALQAWDSQRHVAEAFAKTLSLKCPAWDVYLIYARGIKWKDQNPPAPTFWMHQLNKTAGADPARHLDPSRFTNEVKMRLNNLEPGGVTLGLSQTRLIRNAEAGKPGAFCAH